MVAKSASFGHGSLVCGLWLAGGGLGGSVPTYVLGSFYIRFFLYLGYSIPVLGEAHCTISTVCTKHQKLFPAKTKRPWRECAYVCTWYILHTFFLYLGYGIPVLGEAHCTISTICMKHQKLFLTRTKKTNTTPQLYGTPKYISSM
jgi:hypothetical protein